MALDHTAGCADFRDVGDLLAQIVGAPERELLIEEYLFSDGVVCRVWIEQTLDGIGDANRYFDSVDVERLRRCLLSQPA